MIHLPRVFTRLIKTVGGFFLATALAFPATLVNAAPVSGQFNVTVNLQNPNSPTTPTTGFCTMGPGRNTFGAIVTIVCSTGVVVDIRAPRTAAPWIPIHGGAYRFTRLTEYESLGPQFPDAIDSYTGVGTITTWRRVNLTDREYLEMQVGW